MELYKTEYSQTKGNGKLDKILLKCEESNYYKLTEFLYTSQNSQALVLKALFEYKINIVLKFGILESIQKEYLISNELIQLPNFIRYFCKIKCNENIKNIINNKETISNYKMCHCGVNPVGILVMKYYILGSIDNYDWNENNFDVLKNVIKQVIFAIIYAYKTTGFIHGDLHCGNILLKYKKTNELKYGSKSLIINDLEVVIMDFEKSKLNQQNKITELFRNIDKFITSIIYNNNMKLNIFYDTTKLKKIKSTLIDEQHIIDYNLFEKIINKLILD